MKSIVKKEHFWGIDYHALDGRGCIALLLAVGKEKSATAAVERVEHEARGLHPLEARP